METKVDTTIKFRREEKKRDNMILSKLYSMCVVVIDERVIANF